VKEVYCWNCSLLTSLPCWPEVEIVDCSNCPLLGPSLPCWPKVKEVNCSNCRLLGPSLPCWPKVEQVNCSNCRLLGPSLPCWPQVEQVNCLICPLLGPSLPSWPMLKILGCSHNPNIVEIPCYPNLEKLACVNMVNLLYVRNQMSIFWLLKQDYFYTSEEVMHKRIIVFLSFVSERYTRVGLSKDLWRFLFEMYLKS